MTKRLLPMALAIAVILGAGTGTASADPYLFAFTGTVFPDTGSPTDAVLVINGTFLFNTSQSQIDAGTNNQGWWSPEFHDNDTYDANDNYFVGSIDLGEGLGQYHNFFTFDLSNLDVNVESAELRLTQGGTSGGGGTVDYTLWDVTTSYLTLNDNSVGSQAIFDDLGSGISYGTIAANLDGTPNPLAITLNAAAIEAINRNAGEFFSIGGALPGEVPEPASMALLLIGGGAAAFRARRRRVS